MPTVTCPYCQRQSESKYIHKEHLRVDHAQQFANNIRTSITGAESEISQQTITFVVSDPGAVVVDGDLVSISHTQGFHRYVMEFSLNMFWDLLGDRLLADFRAKMSGDDGISNSEEQIPELHTPSVTVSNPDLDDVEDDIADNEEYQDCDNGEVEMMEVE